MRRTWLILAIACVLVVVAAARNGSLRQGSAQEGKKDTTNMQLGNFSVSLAVKDLQVSQAFYEKLGFQKIGGDPSQNYVILQNQTSTIGLFQGMFEKNILTFNPGWDRNAKALPEFQDVRAIQRELKRRGIEPAVAADEATTGPASMVLMDPDGNQILIDQHVASPGK
jgi:catechol 2,3-dioxygenase-like lactoylglutathione lyase family enzyme